MMDARRSHELPRLQIGWIDNICMPLYSVSNIAFMITIFYTSKNKDLFFQHISFLCDSFNGHIERIKENRKNWSSLNNSNITNKETT